MSDYRTYITQTGFALERDATLNHSFIDYAVLAVGDGILPDDSSPAAQTDLVHPIREYGIVIEKDPDDANVWIARGQIPASDGGFTIREVGIKTASGDLYAYARQAGDYKPLLEEGQGKSYTIRLKFIPGNAQVMQVKIDPSVQFATPTDVGNVELEAKRYSEFLQNKKRLFEVSGTENDIVLTSKVGVTPVTELNELDEFSFIVAATNTTGAVTITIDGLTAINLSGVVSANQVFETALITLRYLSGSFYIANQINPKTGHKVCDILKLYTDTSDVLRGGEYAFNGAALTRSDHPIAFAIAAASSNYVAQATKDADSETYAGYYGDGDGSTTFTLPTLGGEFIRGYDDGRGVDSGRGFGSYQHDTLQNIKGSIVNIEAATYEGITATGIFDTFKATVPDFKVGSDTPDADVDSVSFDASRVARTSDETHPRSIAYFFKTRL